MTVEATHRRTALGVGCAAHIVQDGLTATVFVLLPILAQSFGLSYTQVGLIKGLKAFAQGALEMTSGVVTERTGETRALLLGLALSAVGYVALTGAPDALMVTLSLLVVGIGTAFQHAPSSALIANAYASDGRRGALGLYNSSGDVGKLVFTGLFSLAIGAGLAWQQVSLAYGIIAILAAFAIGLAMRAVGRVARPETSNTGDATTRLGWGILDRRAYGTLWGVVFLDTMVQAGVLVFVAFLMIAKGFAVSTATIATVVLLVGGTFGKAGCGFLADRLGVRPAFALIQALTALGLVLVVIAPGWLAFVILLPLGAVVQGSTSITYGFVADLVHPRRMARGYALMYASSSFSAAVGPFAFGLIADTVGIESAVVSMAVVALLAVPPLVLLRPSRMSEEGPA